MPKYYFHIRDGEELVQDDEGIDLPNLAAAQEEAVQAARDMLVELLRNDLPVNGQKFEICDADGNILAVVAFRQVLKLI